MREEKVDEGVMESPSLLFSSQMGILDWGRLNRVSVCILCRFFSHFFHLLHRRRRGLVIMSVSTARRTLLIGWIRLGIRSE